MKSLISSMLGLILLIVVGWVFLARDALSVASLIAVLVVLVFWLRKAR